MNLSTPRGLMVLIVLMFGFGFALVPIYDVFCEITGLNGKTAGQYEGELTKGHNEQGRQVTMQFIVNKNANLPWDFAPNEVQMSVATGQRRETTFGVTNTYNRAAIAQAVPSVSPSAAAEYLHKIECFCFEQQPLEAGEHKDMPLVFIVDPELPEGIDKITLSYTLFDITSSTDPAIDPHKAQKVGN
jgi:cytochrome c oxidase assembly protein subunit 11